MRPDLEFLQQIAAHADGAGPVVYLSYEQLARLSDLAGKYYDGRVVRSAAGYLVSRLSLTNTREAIALGTERVSEQLAKDVATLLEKAHAPGP